MTKRLYALFVSKPVGRRGGTAFYRISTSAWTKSVAVIMFQDSLLFASANGISAELRPVQEKSAPSAPGVIVLGLIVAETRSFVSLVDLDAEGCDDPQEYR